MYRSLGGTDGDSGQDTVYLGQEGKEFSFDDLKNEVDTGCNNFFAGQVLYVFVHCNFC